VFIVGDKEEGGVPVRTIADSFIHLLDQHLPLGDVVVGVLVPGGLAAHTTRIAEALQHKALQHFTMQVDSGPQSPPFTQRTR
jgi:hypothetical protein